MGQQGVQAALRLSPHYYNTEDDIDRSSPIVALDDERAPPRHRSAAASDSSRFAPIDSP